LGRSQEPVLLTGATGFIGRRLQSLLLNRGHRLRALLRPDSTHRDHLETAVECVEGHLTDPRVLKTAVAGAGAVIYAAGAVRGRTREDFAAANVDGVECLVQALHESDLDIPVLLVSSMAASRPGLSLYAGSKHQGELGLQRYHADSNEPPWCILRPPAVYGPGDKEMLPLLKLAGWGVAPVLGSAGQRLSLIHVDDLCGAIAAWIEHWQQCRGRTYSIDDGRAHGYSWRDIVECAGAKRFRPVRLPAWLLRSVAHTNVAISRLTGSAPMLTPGKVNELTQPDWLCDNAPFTRDTGWLPAIGLEQGLGDLLNGATGTAAGQ
jgi:nucleoside-diphosphate-sugar epimerase